MGSSRNGFSLDRDVLGMSNKKYWTGCSNERTNDKTPDTSQHGSGAATVQGGGSFTKAPYIGLYIAPHILHGPMAERKYKPNRDLGTNQQGRLYCVFSPL